MLQSDLMLSVWRGNWGGGVSFSLPMGESLSQVSLQNVRQSAII